MLASTVTEKDDNLIDLNAYSESANAYVQDIVIDSTKTYYAYDTVSYTHLDVYKRQLFNSKNNESSIWEKIPAGLSIVSWNGAFGFDIILFNERGAPRWTSR